jgi:hypothetical protein
MPVYGSCYFELLNEPTPHRHVGIGGGHAWPTNDSIAESRPLAVAKLYQQAHEVLATRPPPHSPQQPHSHVVKQRRSREAEEFGPNIASGQATHSHAAGWWSAVGVTRAAVLESHGRARPPDDLRVRRGRVFRAAGGRNDPIGF